MLVVYAVSNPARISPYDHFVRQADAWLHGRMAIDLPVPSSPDAPENGYFQDVLPVYGPDGRETGQALIPFPPLPAVVLLPFVAIWGLATNAQWIATVLGALVVGLGFWMLGRLPVSRRTRVAATVFFGLGTVFWYASAIGTTWFLAHVVAAGLTFLAIGLALEADPRAIAELGGDDPSVGECDVGPSAGVAAADMAAADVAGARPGGPIARVRSLVDARQVLVGLLFGLACTARLTVVFGAPFFVLVGGGGTWWRRGLSAGIGAAVPLVAFAAYNLATTGSVFHPGYEYQYRLEASNYTFLGYNPDWAIEDPRYLPQNLALMLGGLPDVLPACAAGVARGLFDAGCPYLVPNAIGMSVLLTSPGWLLAVPALRDYGRSRIVSGAVLAVVLIAVMNLMHFSQGWVQFGYRFSNDVAPFALSLVALGIEWLGGARRRLVVTLIALSVVVNAWGVAWAAILGW